MAFVILKSNWGTQKPVPGSTINWGHPLAAGLIACYLFNEEGQFGGQTRNLVGTGWATAVAGASGKMAWTPDWWNGQAPFYDHNTTSPYAYDHGYFASESNLPLTPATGPVSCFGRAIRTYSTAVLGQCPFSRVTGVADFKLQWNDLGGAKYLLFQSWKSTAPGYDNLTAPVNSAIPPLFWFSWGVTGDASGKRIYQNGALIVSNAVAFESQSPNVPFRIGAGPTAEGWRGYVHPVYYWQRNLTADEMWWLHVEPYAFIAPPAVKRAYFFFGISAGGRRIWPVEFGYTQIWH